MHTSTIRMTNLNAPISQMRLRRGYARYALAMGICPCNGLADHLKLGLNALQRGMTLLFSSWLHGSLRRWRAAQNPLLGQLDITTAEAQMAQRELAIVKADALALKEDVRALGEDLQYERETSMAARRRADASEREIADHEREVRAPGGRLRSPTSVSKAAMV